jgi:RNA polymerase sigma-70 factor (ECF subfamily)
VGDPESASGAGPPPDHSLIRSFLRSGDPTAFRKLVERHLPSIRRLLYTLFNGQREEMEDAEQEIILSLLQGLGRYQFRSSFRTYFYSLARNRGVDCLRRKRSRERLLVRLRSGLGDEQEQDPEKQALRREELRSLIEVFHTLPFRDRQLILMKDVEGFSVEEMAEVLKAPAGTVKSRLHRARGKLARRLERSEE